MDMIGSNANIGHFRIIILLFLSCVISKIIADEMYSYYNKKGNLVVTNMPHDGVSKMKLPDVPVYVRPMTKLDVQAHGYTPSLNNYNHRSVANQLEMGRVVILNEELTHEKNALQQSQELLNTAKSLKNSDPNVYNNRIRVLSDSVIEHQKNIEILTKQLQN